MRKGGRGTIYVRARNVNGWSPWSEGTNFTIGERIDRN